MQKKDATGAWFVLVGMSGAGKTEMGKALGIKARAPFIDVDRLASEAAGMPASDVFEKQGEAAWRLLELDALGQALSVSGAIVALGAGAPGHAPVMEMLLRAKERGVLCAWLDESDEVIAARLSSDASRPLLMEASDLTATLSSQRAAREKAYARLADAKFGGEGQSLDASVNEALRVLYLASPPIKSAF